MKIANIDWYRRYIRFIIIIIIIIIINQPMPMTLNNKENKGRYKESTIRGHTKNLYPRWDSNPRPSVF